METNNRSKLKTACNSALPENNIVKTIYKGKTMFFCEEECLKEFNEDPKKFMKSDHYKHNPRRKWLFFSK